MSVQGTVSSEPQADQRGCIRARVSAALVTALALVTLLSFFLHADPCVAQEELPTSRWGKVLLFRGNEPSKGLVILLSDRGGPDESLKSQAKTLSEMGLAVGLIDLRSYLAQVNDTDDECLYLAGEFERLGQVLEKQVGTESYRRAIVSGVGDGAVYAAAALAQHPASFAGAILSDFCQKFSGKIPPCAEGTLAVHPQKEGESYLLTVDGEDWPWAVIRSAPACGDSARSFFEKPAANVVADTSDRNVPLAKAPSVQARIKEYLDRQIGAAPLPAAVADLPLTELAAKDDDAESFVIFLSGDGGWASIDKSIGEDLVDHGVSVVGLDSLRYFWSEKAPADAAADLARVITFYEERWQKTRVYLVGYSFGADVMPAIYNALPSKVRLEVAGMTLLNPSLSTDMEIHLSDWLFDPDDSGLPLLPEVQKMKSLPVLCLYAEDEEEETVCEKELPPRWSVAKLPGDHHFDGDYEKLASLIREHMAKAMKPGEKRPSEPSKR